MNQEYDKSIIDSDNLETQEWLESLQAVIEREGPERAHYLIQQLVDYTRRSGGYLPYKATTAYIPSRQRSARSTRATLSWKAGSGRSSAGMQWRPWCAPASAVGNWADTLPVLLPRRRCMTSVSITFSVDQTIRAAATWCLSRVTHRRASMHVLSWKEEFPRSNWTVSARNRTARV